MVISVTASVLTHRHRASQATGQLSSLEGINPSITRWHRPAIATAVRRWTRWLAAAAARDVAARCLALAAGRGRRGVDA